MRDQEVTYLLVKNRTTSASYNGIVIVAESDITAFDISARPG